MGKRDRYHHGDLRRALLEEATQRVEADGAEQLSLRACARTLQVDPAAAYRHFKDKSAILGVVAATHHEALVQMTVDAAAEGTGEERLLQLITAYVEFAVHRTHLFRLVYGPHGPATDAPPLGITHALDAVYAERGVDPEEALGPEADELAWAAIHGLATLAADGRIEHDPLTLQARAEAMCELILGGLEALEG
ncbi:MAG: TetR/AcrR family transcriptional regulator [Bradymonadia bacterium]